MNSTYSIVSAIQSSCADLGLPVPSDSEASWVIGMSLESALYRCVPTLTAEQVPLFIDRYRHHYFGTDQDDKLFDGVVDLFRTLQARQVKLAVATGKSRSGLDRVLVSTGLGRYFDITRCADETRGKPDPTMLFEIMTQLNLEPERVLMVGDTTHDILMAVNAGVDSMAVTYGAHDIPTLESAEPTVMVTSVPEMQSWLLDRL